MQNSSTDELNRRLSRFLTALYPMTPMRLWLVVSWPDKRQLGSQSGRSSLEPKWYDVGELQNARQYIRTLAGHHDIYIGVGLRHPACAPDPKHRGRSQDVYALPGLWIEFDHRDGVHTATNLPTSSEVLAFIETLPIRFSLLIDSGGGMHCYLLFRELWILETPEQQQQAAKLLRDFQYTIRQWAGRQGWHVDATDDLARVLRPAGTLNHKGNDLRPISILRETDYRVNPSEIGEAPWLQDAPAESPRQTAPDGSFPLARLEPITDGCAWICHCRDDAATLSEPEWYALLSLLVRCEDGEAVAHQWSRPYPRYNSEETVAKLAHALRDAGPRTCVNIREIGGEPFCSHCPYWERITSPIVLGTTSPSTRSETTTRDRSNSRSNQQTRVSRPLIDASVQHLPTVTTKAWDALRAYNQPPGLFRHGGLPSRLERNDDKELIIKDLNPPRMRHVLARAANWYTTAKTKEGIIKVPAKPPIAPVGVYHECHELIDHGFRRRPDLHAPVNVVKIDDLHEETVLHPHRVRLLTEI